MAISIVNITPIDSLSFSNTLTCSIPATTVGNTLIVLVSNTDINNQGLGVTSCEDDQANTAAWTRVTFSPKTMSRTGNSYDVDIYYRANVPAGLTFVTAHFGSSGSAASMNVVEVAGINRTSPFEIASSLYNASSGVNPHIGAPIATAFTNALFVSAAMRTASGNFSSANTGWTSLPRLHGGVMQSYIIASGTQTPGYNGGATVEILVAAAIFNPTPNAFTLDLNETLTTTDGAPVQEPEIDKDDSISLSDFIDFILSTNTYFRTFTESLVTADSFSRVWSAFTTLQESLTCTDNISFIRDTFRTYSENIDIKDWLSLKKSSQPWGN